MKQKKQTILLIGDTHIPYHKKDLFDFYELVKKTYKPTEVIHMGDLIDNHAISYHESSAELRSAGDELNKSIIYIEWLAEIFPKMDILQGNHDKLPIRKARTAGLPSRYIKNNHDVFNMPKTWNWVNEKYLDMSDGRKLWLRHQFCTNPIYMALKHNVCVAQGHYHTKSELDWVMNKKRNVWALTVGCGIDDESLAYEYNKLDKDRPQLSVVVITNGLPKFVFMEVDENKNWTGELK